MAAAGNSSFVGSLYMTMGLNSSSFVSGFVAAKAVAKQSTDQISGEIAKMNTATRGASQGMAQLGQQISDIGVQATMGTNPFMIFSQQVPQVTYALSHMNGAVGRLGAALSGPFGAAAIAAIGFIGMFVSKTREANREAEDAAGKGLKSLADRMRELAGLAPAAFGVASSALGTEFGQEQKKNADEIQRLTRLMIEAEREKVRLMNSPIQDDTTIYMIAKQGLAIEKYRKQIKELSETTLDQQSAFNDMAIAAADRRIEAARDKAKAITQAYEEQRTKLIQLRQAGKISASEYESEMAKAMDARDAQLKSLEDQKAAAEEAKRTSERYAESLKAVVDQALPGVAAMRDYREQVDLFRVAASRGLVSVENYAVGLKALENAMLDSVAGQRQKTAIEQWNPKKALEINTKGMTEYVDGYIKQMKRVQQSNREARQSAALFASTVTSGFTDAIFSGKSLSSMFKGLINDIGQMTIKLLVMKPIAEALTKSLEGIGGGKGIFGLFGGARANGGPVSAGKTYLVGERGPELFTPGVSGNIIPNDKIGGGSNMGVYVQPSPYFDVVVKKISGQVAMETSSVGSMAAVAETDRRSGYRTKTSLVGY